MICQILICCLVLLLNFKIIAAKTIGQHPCFEINYLIKIMQEKPQSFSGNEKQEHQPGKEHEMAPRPEYINKNYKASGKLQGKKALISGGDSG